MFQKLYSYNTFTYTFINTTTFLPLRQLREGHIKPIHHQGLAGLWGQEADNFKTGVSVRRPSRPQPASYTEWEVKTEMSSLFRSSAILCEVSTFPLISAITSLATSRVFEEGG